MFDEAEILRAAGGDAEFQLAARFWTSTIRLDAGDSGYLLRIEDGRVLGLAPADAHRGEEFDVRISAPREDWDELLRPVPRPFYQDLMAAVWRQGFKLEGDLIGFAPYYQAMNRLFELMRTARAGRRA